MLLPQYNFQGNSFFFFAEGIYIPETFSLKNLLYLPFLFGGNLQSFALKIFYNFLFSLKPTYKEGILKYSFTVYS